MNIGTEIVFCFLQVFGILTCNGTIGVLGIQSRSLNPMIARPGDINVAILSQISSYDKSRQQCSQQPVVVGCQELEMAIYVTEKINRRSDLLPNVTLGFVAIDGCSNDMKSLEMVTYVLEDETTCPTSTVLETTTTVPMYGNASNVVSSELRHYRAIGLVCSGSSRVAAAISPLLGTYQIPLIGMTSSSDELSDKSRYQYYLRLIAADSFQVLAVLGVARHYGWQYLSVVYTEGSYGENALKQIQAHLNSDASDYGICIATAVMISSLADQEEFDDIADQLVRNRIARVIAVFVESSYIIEPLFKSLNDRIDPKWFILISGDALNYWEFGPIVSYDILDGAIFLEHTSFPMPEFEQYLSTTTPLQSQGNTWVLKLWENTYHCTFGSVESDNPIPPCSMNLTLDSNVCPAMPSMENRVHDAFMIFAEAAHKVIEENCPQEFTQKSDLQNCLKGDKILQKLLNSTFHGILGTIDFTATGDFMENLEVKQISTIDNVRRSRVVGLWDTGKSEAIMNESLIMWDMFYNKTTSEDTVYQPPVSVCSHPCRPNTYVIPRALSCCWTCAKCRSNEIILPTRNGCKTCPNFTWPDDETSMNCLPIELDYLRYSDAISICMICLAVLLGIVVVFCGTFFFIKRQNKLVKAMSIQLSLLILFGKLAACITIILFLVPADSSSSVCVARSVGFHFGICMIYSPLLVKNIRIYRIFSAGKKSVKAPRFVSTEAQLLITFAFLLVELVLVVISEALSTSVATLVMASTFEKYVELYCYKATLWFLIPLAYNIAIMLLCAVIGFVTRKLPNNFNESWFIFISVATTLFSWIVFIPAYFTVSQAHLQAAILGFALALICIVTLICQYVPVLYALLFVPKENVITGGTSIGTRSVNAVSPG